NDGVAEFLAERAELIIIRRGDRLHAAVLRDGEVLPAPFVRNRLPDFARAFELAALDGVDDHAAARGLGSGRGRRRFLLVVFVRRRVADEEDDLRGASQRARVLRPAGLSNAVRAPAAHL